MTSTIIILVTSFLYMGIYNFFQAGTTKLLKGLSLDVRYLIGYLVGLVFSIVFLLIRNSQPIVREYTFDIIIESGVIVGVLTTIYGITLVLLRLTRKDRLYNKLIKPLR